METQAERSSSSLSYSEIRKRLRGPIPAELLSHKPAGKGENATKIPYVNVTDVKDLLDQRVGLDAWEAMLVSDTVAGDVYICWVRLTITASDGAFSQDGCGDCNIVVKGYGSVSTNAYAQALRRAAEGHGLARELWRGELSDEQRELPATAHQIAELHQEMTRLGKNEAAAASYYTGGRVDLFGEMTQDEAEKALQQLRRLKKK
jgi:hypothetical protein